MDRQRGIAVAKAAFQLGIVEAALEALQAITVEESESFYTVNALLLHLERLEKTIERDIYV